MTANGVAPVRSGLGCRPGFTLLEMALVMVVLGGIVLVSTVLVLGSFRLEQAAATALHRRAAEAALADQFRGDVAGAVAAPDRLDKLTAGPACLLLRTGDGRHIVYRWHAPRLERSERVGPAERPPRILFQSESDTIEFGRSGKDSPLLTLRLVRLRQPGNVKRVLEMAAALGGDYR